MQRTDSTISEPELDALTRHGFGVAYRMLGSVSDAEDVAQDAILRLTHAEAPIAEPAAWITTVATRLSINVLRSARKRRETYIGPWLPEPLIDATAACTASDAALADSLSQAFLVMLERLSPLERAAFLLREAFDYDYTQIAQILQRNEANARQLVTRARKHLSSDRPRFDPDENLRERLLERFVAAAEEGDLDGLESLLAEDAVLYTDGGGQAAAARKPVRGTSRIARAMVSITRNQRRRGRIVARRASVNGQPGQILRNSDGTIRSVLSIDVLDGQVQTIRIIRNPDKLTHL